MTHLGDWLAAAAFALLAAITMWPLTKSLNTPGQTEAIEAPREVHPPASTAKPEPVPETQPADEVSIRKQLQLTLDPKLLELQRLMTKQQVQVGRIERRIDQLEQQRVDGNGQH